MRAQPMPPSILVVSDNVHNATDITQCLKQKIHNPLIYYASSTEAGAISIQHILHLIIFDRASILESTIQMITDSACSKSTPLMPRTFLDKNNHPDGFATTFIERFTPIFCITSVTDIKSGESPLFDVLDTHFSDYARKPVISPAIASKTASIKPSPTSLAMSTHDISPQSLPIPALAYTKTTAKIFDYKETGATANGIFSQLKQQNAGSATAASPVNGLKTTASPTETDAKTAVKNPAVIKKFPEKNKSLMFPDAAKKKVEPKIAFQEPGSQNKISFCCFSIKRK